ncbi:lasso peptide biosynthesis B2 protein [Rhodococcoides corynebacterioides]|uniref:Lasso peptide biosynthesis B2 protein n=2 Tax=Rhodococcoides corynebacterioides TaxID=53972 RepID=A0ABS7P116_9NOCA|nr:lasso peptide biosynthesis B2 protein [Rhodococcus corynebacterioides]MBY6366077.1 lasso peptide biosynthesis B2 protein [Rhodococcus corynebacterioides]MBY6406965.1 lasso peptide biosynthesis B2 protein [Rhodococcus corynebacterioides]
MRALATICITTARLLVRLQVTALVRVLTLVSRNARPATHWQAERSRDAVIVSSIYCADQNGCLLRSTSAALLCLVRYQRWPAWLVGVQERAPFAAHAWIEADATPVGEAKLISQFRPLIEVSAGP